MDPPLPPDNSLSNNIPNSSRLIVRPSIYVPEGATKSLCDTVSSNDCDNSNTSLGLPYTLGKLLSLTSSQDVPAAEICLIYIRYSI